MRNPLASSPKLPRNFAACGPLGAGALGRRNKRVRALRVLITGAGGFVGKHLAAHLAQSQASAQLFGTTLFASESVHPAISSNRLIDLKDYAQVRDLLADCRPDAVYHLAAQAFVPRSFEAPWETLENNILSQLNIIRACLELTLRPRMLIVSSAEIYGQVSPEQLPWTKTAPFVPPIPTA